MASTVKPAGKKVVAKKPAMTSKRAAALEQAEEAAAVVPLQVNKLRETRMLDEKKRKVRLWHSHLCYKLSLSGYLKTGRKLCVCSVRRDSIFFYWEGYHDPLSRCLLSVFVSLLFTFHVSVML